MTTKNKIAYLDDLCYAYFTEQRSEPVYEETPEYNKREEILFNLEYNILRSECARNGIYVEEEK